MFEPTRFRQHDMSAFFGRKIESRPAFSTLLTLLVLPALYARFGQRRPTANVITLSKQKLHRSTAIE
jgi:hypothetical protein